MPAEKDDQTQIAVLAEAVKNAVDSIARVEGKVNELLSIDRTMAQIQEQSVHQQTEIKQIWERVDGQGREIQTLATETRAFINRAGGAWVAAAMALSLAQVVAFAWVAWVFNSVQSTRELAAVHEYRLKVLEQRDQGKAINER